MSEDFQEPSSDSFWEIGQYKRTVKRCEDGYKLCNDLVQMISDRADIEKAYSKSLKAWSKKWNEYLLKGSEYGTMKSTWTSTLNEADKLAEIHYNTHNVLIDELNNEIKNWQKTNYIKSIVNQLKITKEYEEEFKKAQKPWSKKYLVVEKTKKDYHSACKSYQSAKVQHSNSLADTAISPDQKKKLEDKVEKYKKEVEITKNKYKQSIDDINSYNSRYIEDMNTVYKKCDQFEKERLEFFIEKFFKLQSHLNINEKTNIADIYSELFTTIKKTNPVGDLQYWSKENGALMNMNWPIFEEYSEELKTIAKGRAKLAKDHSENNGVTMTSIRLKNDDGNESNMDTRSISNAGNDSANRIHQNDNCAKAVNIYLQVFKKTRSESSSPTSSCSSEYVYKEANFDSFNQTNDEYKLEQATSMFTRRFIENFSGFSDIVMNQRASENKANISNHHSNSNNSKESVSNPFGDYDDDEEAGHQNGSFPKHSNDDSDDEVKNSVNQDSASYLNIKVKALYDYNSAEEDELSFKAGEEFIKLANEDDRGWCLGKIGSRIGLYPATYATNA